MTVLHLAPALRARIASEAEGALPRECCGLIEGVRAGNDLRATALHAMPNIAAGPDRFEIDSAGHFALLRALRGTGRAVIGCYHSHPNGRPELSARDREFLSDDGFVWLVAAVGAGGTAFAAFACEPGQTDAISPVPLAPIV